MLKSDECYEVAKWLRGLDVHDWNDYEDEINSLESAIECNVGQQFEYQPWWHRLADLIDPTCKNIGDDYMFKCSKCGAEFEPVTANRDEYGEVFYASLKPQYCSHCGARVVN